MLINFISRNNNNDNTNTIENITQEMQNHLCLSASTAEVVSYWLLLLSTQATDCEN
jgi:hypothetical protein